MVIGALIVTHGKLGEILVEEVEHLVGRQEKFQALSTLGLSAETITQNVSEMIGSDPYIVFTDTPGTSPSLRSATAIKEGQAVITGVNIGMLISFIMYRDRIGIEELAERMVRDGRRCVEVKWARNQQKA